MKTIIQTICAGLLLATVPLKAQNSNNLVVFSESGERFYLILNGLKYNKTPETNVKVVGLNAASYKAKVIFEKPLADVDGTVHLMWEGVAVTNKEFSYEVVRKGDHHKLKFISQADIGGSNASNSVVYNADGSAGGSVSSANVTTSTNSSSVANDPGNGSVTTNVNGGGYNSSTTVTSTTATTGPQSGNVGISMNVDGMNMSVNVNGTGPNAAGTMNGSNTTVSTTSTTYTSSSNSYGTTTGTTQNNTPVSGTSNPTPANGAGCYTSMSDPDFNNLVGSISAKSFEDARLKIAKQGVSANCVNSAQVKKLMELFTFEDNKLEIAKYSYDHTTDKNNYYIVNDGFGFESSVDNLNDYISKKK